MSMFALEELDPHIEALRLNADRASRVLNTFRSGSITAEDIRAKNPELTKEVLDALHGAGLLSRVHDEARDRVIYPAWQFRKDGAVREDLDDINSALQVFPTDIITENLVMNVIQRPELGGDTIIQALDSDQLEVRNSAWEILNSLGNGF